MSKLIILNILSELGGIASQSEIKNRIDQEYPNRTIKSYLHKRINSLKNDGFIKKNDGNNESKWEITQKGKCYKEKTWLITNIDKNCSVEQLESRGVKISNIVSTIDVNTELNLGLIAEKIQNSHYHSEADSHLNYTSNKNSYPTLRVPSTGRITITGATNKLQVQGALDSFFSKLNNMNYNISWEGSEIIVQNIVATADLNRELDVYELSKDFENIIVNDDFSGAKYTTPEEGTGMIYRTGKVVITGVRRYIQINTIYDEIVAKL